MTEREFRFCTLEEAQAFIEGVESAESPQFKVLRAFQDLEPINLRSDPPDHREAARDVFIGGQPHRVDTAKYVVVCSDRRRGQYDPEED